MSFCKSMHFYEKNTKHTTNLINTLFPKVCIFTTKTFYMSLISCHKLVHVPPHFLSQFMSTRARGSTCVSQTCSRASAHTIIYTFTRITRFVRTARARLHTKCSCYTLYNSSVLSYKYYVLSWLWPCGASLSICAHYIKNGIDGPPNVLFKRPKRRAHVTKHAKSRSYILRVKHNKTCIHFNCRLIRKTGQRSCQLRHGAHWVVN